MLVLSLFPGLDLLGRGFEEEEFVVVRGPDPVWGGDIRSFHSPSGVWDGVIGGPPCQQFSQMASLNKSAGRWGNLIPEFCRVVAEAQPRWWLMENVRAAPDPLVDGYLVETFLLNNRWQHGTCGLCLCGLLVGWPGNDVECSYKRCHRPAVARGRGRKRICTKHAFHQGLAAAIKLPTWWQLLEEG